MMLIWSPLPFLYFLLHSAFMLTVQAFIMKFLFQPLYFRFPCMHTYSGVDSGDSWVWWIERDELWFSSCCLLTDGCPAGTAHLVAPPSVSPATLHLSHSKFKALWSVSLCRKTCKRIQHMQSHFKMWNFAPIRDDWCNRNEGRVRNCQDLNSMPIDRGGKTADVMWTMVTADERKSLLHSLTLARLSGRFLLAG